MCARCRRDLLGARVRVGLYRVRVLSAHSKETNHDIVAFDFVRRCVLDGAH